MEPAWLMKKCESMKAIREVQNQPDSMHACRIHLK